MALKRNIYIGVDIMDNLSKFQHVSSTLGGLVEQEKEQCNIPFTLTASTLPWFSFKLFLQTSNFSIALKTSNFFITSIQFQSNF